MTKAMIGLRSIVMPGPLQWRAANPQSPEQKANAAAKSRKWRQENKQRYETYLTAWRNAHREQFNAQQNSFPTARRTKPRAAKKEPSDKTE